MWPLLVTVSLLSATGSASPQTPTVTIAPSAPLLLTEGGAQVDISVELSAAQAGPVTVPFSIIGTAVLVDDYSVIQASPLVIPAGATSAVLSLVAGLDGLHEGPESISISLQTPTGADLGTVFEHSLVLSDVDPAPSLSFEIARSWVVEDQGVLPVRLVLDSVSALPVDFGCFPAGSGSAGSALMGTDFSFSGSLLQIPPGSLDFVLPVTLIDDALQERTETLRLVIDPALTSGATVGSLSVHTVTIRDEDSAPLPVIHHGLQITPALLVLPQTRVGETSLPGLLSITNTDVIPRTVLGLAFGGTRPEQFSSTLVDHTVPFVLAPGESAGLTVWTSPSASGNHTAFLRVLQSPAGAPTTGASVSALGLGPLGEDILMHSGWQPVTTQNGAVFAPDFGSDGAGTLSSHGRPITGTPDDRLYQTQRQGAQLAYSFALPSGDYELVFHFAEPEHHLTGLRVFDIVAEGQLLVSDFDVIALAGEWDLAVSSGALQITVADGGLDLQLTASVGEALFQALEVRSIAVIETLPVFVDFGSVPQGLPSQAVINMHNSGLREATLTRISMTPNLGSAQDFTLEVDGDIYSGSGVKVNHLLNQVIAPGALLSMPLTFTPSEHAHHHIDITFLGDFTSTQVAVDAEGSAEATWGFLHPAIARTPQLMVDYDGDGQELLQLSGAESHTHEPGRNLVGYEWAVDGAPFSSAVDTTVLLPVGTFDLSLEVTDDGLPPFSATAHEAVQVHTADRVPEVLALYYLDPAGSPANLLDNPPARADFIERTLTLGVALTNGTLGGSHLTGSSMVELRCNFTVGVQADYQFMATGGSDRRVLVDGVLHSAPLTLTPGQHNLVARFAVPDATFLPVSLLVYKDGVLMENFTGSVTHDETNILPVIHSMPGAGIEAGGTRLTVEGFGFVPEDQVTLHWGATSFPAASLLGVLPGSLTLITPSGTGIVSVWVETPVGLSNAVDFEYTSSGPVPIVWNSLSAQNISVLQPTSLAFGPDGRLYVGQRPGTIQAYTLDSAWNVIAVDSFLGVSNLSNSDLLGIAFDPYDATAGGSLRIFVSHGEHYANGGGSFSSTSFYSGQVSVLEGPNFDTPLPLIWGLPVSNHDHSVNGLEFDHDGNLLIAVGGNTNAGVTWPIMGDLPESPLSAAILRAWIKRPAFDGQITYTITATGAPSNDQRDGEIVDLVTGDVSVLAPGLRNAYDLVLATSGLIYATDNGPNGGFGPWSTGASTDSGGQHANDIDSLELIEEGRYLGHPNRSRGRSDERQNVFHSTLAAAQPGVYSPPLTPLDSSVDGIVEYRSEAFNGQLRGTLVVQKWNEAQHLVALAPGGRSVESLMFVSPEVHGLDVTSGSGGVLITADFTSNLVRFIEPASGTTGVLAVYDVHPWRAPETGGGRFVLGGRSFGDLSNTTVLIGGLPATLTAVEATRIEGLLPAASGAASATLVDIVVQVGVVQDTLTAAFRWLPGAPGWSRGAWSTGVDLPDALGEVAVANLDGKLFVMGEGTTKTYAFDLASGVWDSTLAQRIFAQAHHFAIEVVDGKLYCFGGLGGSQGSLQIYDPASDTWTLGAPMPWAGGSCSSATIDGLVYASGGIVGGTTVGNLAVYDPVLDQWNPSGPLPSMPTPVNHAASGTDGRYLWVFGGRAGPNTPQPGFQNVQRYDPATATWTDSAQPGSPLSPMPLARGGSGHAVWHGERFFIFGGESSGGQVFNDVQAYTPATDIWTLDEPMPTARHGIFPVLEGNRIFLIGGGVTAGFSASAVVEILLR